MLYKRRLPTPGTIPVGVEPGGRTKTRWRRASVHARNIRYLRRADGSAAREDLISATPGSSLADHQLQTAKSYSDAEECAARPGDPRLHHASHLILVLLLPSRRHRDGVLELIKIHRVLRRVIALLLLRRFVGHQGA